MSEVSAREVFERSREASGAGHLEAKHERGPSREVFERSREVSVAGHLEAKHERGPPPRGLRAKSSAVPSGAEGKQAGLEGWKHNSCDQLPERFLRLNQTQRSKDQRQMIFQYASAQKV